MGKGRGAAALLIGLATSTFMATQATAQEAVPATQQTPEPQNYPDIVVTAQKRSQRLQDVGIAVTALGAEGIAELGRQDVTALVTKVPGLQANQFSPTITVFNIRGVSQNDFADSQEAPIAFYSDEAYVSALGAISGQTFDLERVEVLRGPQGTLFGRNATGGLIQVTSAKPTDMLDGFLTLTGGSYGQFATEGAISGPISDKLRGRLSFTSDNHRGYIDNTLGRALGGARFYASRLQLAADLGPGELTLKGTLLANDHDSGAGMYTAFVTVPNADGLGAYIPTNDNPYGTCPGCSPFGYRPDTAVRRVSLDHQPDFNRRYWGLSARYVADLGAITLTSITDYQNLAKNYTEDSDVSPVDGFVYTTSQRLYQLSQELRLSHSGPRLTWVAGLYGLKINSDNGYTADLSNSFGLRSDYGGTLETKSFAVFGQAEYKINTLVSVIGGLRYSYDNKKYYYFNRMTGATDFYFNPTLYPDLADKTFENYSAKGELDLRPNKNTLLYFSVNRGTKAGGFGTTAFQPIDPATLPFKQEVLTNYEGGFKLTLFDRTTHFNASIFHYDYKDYQAFTIVGLSQAIVNNNARVNGLEVEIDSRPAVGLYLQAFVSLLNTKVFGITLPSGRIADRVMPQAPKTSIGGQVRYEFSVGKGKAALQTDWKYNSSQWFSTFNAPVDLEAGYVVGNARASYTFDGGHWEAAVFVNNLTDKTYRIYNLDLTNPIGLTQSTFARPRWIGGSLTYRIR